MKLKFLVVISVLIVGGLIAFNYDPDTDPSAKIAEPLPCAEPLTYRFGDIDSRYNITKKQLASIMKEVEDLWATALDRDLLDYHPDGKVVIRLIYSEEQRRTEDEQTFSKRIRMKQEQIDVQRREYQRLADNYKKREKDFKKTLSKYNQLAESYNETAEKWNGENITDRQLSKLNEMERQIKELKPVLNQKQGKLESLRQRTNAKSEQLNRLVDEQNKLIDTYNNRFGGSMEFDQGQFVKKGNNESIRIFQFSDHSQLKTVLAHEAGHALGLQHVSNPKSIMYHMMGEQNIFNLALTDEDVSAIKQQCDN